MVNSIIAVWFCQSRLNLHTSSLLEWELFVSVWLRNIEMSESYTSKKVCKEKYGACENVVKDS